MPRFSQFIYNTATYGVKSALPLSADPMTAVAVLYDAVALSFASPTSPTPYVEFRIVRNQENYPQSQEDGAVIFASFGQPLVTTITDGQYTDRGSVASFSELPPASLNQLYTVKPDGNQFGQAYVWNGTTWKTPAPLVSGKFVYYRAWIKTSANSDWVQAGTTFTLIPKINSLSLGRDTVYTSSEVPTRDRLVFKTPTSDSVMSTTHERFMSTIPAVFVSETNSSFDVTNDVYDPVSDPSGTSSNSLISTFLSAFSYTVDEFVTWARGIYPDNQNHRAGEAAIIFKSHELGIKPDYEGVTLTQKKLLSNAVEVYKSKGTRYGLELFSESLTGYYTDVTATRNLLLSHEDSTFDIPNWTSGVVGNWTSLSGTPILSVDNGQTPAEEADSLDNDFSLKVVTGGTNKYISLGTNNPITQGIPVTEGVKYSLSFYVQQASNSNVTPEIRWYDRNGLFISTTAGTSTSTYASFAKVSLEKKVAPAGAVYAALAIKFAANADYYVDMVQFEKSSGVVEKYSIKQNKLTITTDYLPELYVGRSFVISGITAINGGYTVETINDAHTEFTVDKTASDTDGDVYASGAIEFGVSDYQEPRGAVVNLAPTKTNLVRNPSFEEDVTGWTNINSVDLVQVPSTTSESASGDYHASIPAASSDIGWLIQADSYVFGLRGGRPYTLSAYIKDAGSDCQYRAEIEFADGNNTRIMGSATTVTSTGWTRVSVSGVAPDGVTAAYIFFRSVTGASSETDTAYIDAVQFEEAETATDYFDGSFDTAGAWWAGTTNYSNSYYYMGVSNKAARLQEEIKDYLGINTPYYIKFYGNPTITGSLSGIA